VERRKGVGLCDSLPWEGVGRGFVDVPIPEIADEPLPAITHFHHTPPRGGN